MLTTASYGWLQDFYNFLKDDAGEDATTAMVSTTTAQRQRSTLSSFSFRRKNGYSGYLESTAAASAREGGFDGFMNTVIKKKLGIIPKDLSCVRRAVNQTRSFLLLYPDDNIISDPMQVGRAVWRCLRRYGWGLHEAQDPGGGPAARARRQYYHLQRPGN